jgi:hypothetical protein
MKRCGHCGEMKPLAAFAKDSPSQRSRTGLKSWCRACAAAGYKAWKAAHPEHKEQKRAASHKWYSENRERHAASKLKNRYGITPAQYLGMVTAQDGKCFICGLATKLHIDHDHATKEVRKLLCIGCNTSVGYLESRILRVGLKKFLLYLRRRYAA